MTIESKESSVQLRIVEADNRDVNAGIVRINQTLFRTIPFKEGDFVALTNARTKSKTAAAIKPSLLEEIAPNEIKACPALRRNLKAKLSDVITIRKTCVVPAKKIVFESLDKSVQLKNESVIAQKLLGRAVMIRDVFSFNSPKGRVDLRVVKYSPKEAEAVLIREGCCIEVVSAVKEKN
jgi:hypothetical protein